MTGPANQREPIIRFTDEYAFLSNFFESPITLPSGYRARTVEHAFQAAKIAPASPLAAQTAHWILSAETPGQAKRRGHNVRPLRADWDDVRVDVMRELLALKFAEGSALAAALVYTGDAPLVEGNTWHDRFWGRCFCVAFACNGAGRNQLGLLLMERRDALVELMAAEAERGYDVERLRSRPVTREES